MPFFDLFPRFTETSKTGATKDRLNRRYIGLIQHNLNFISRRTVLDIAAHDGRWSFAALHAGARHVTGIEARPHLVASAKETFALYGALPSMWNFICGDIFSVMKDAAPRADTVLLLGFLYHTPKHMELLELIAATGADAIIIDTNVAPDADAIIRLATEPTDQEGNAIGSGESQIVGLPSRQAVISMVEQLGFTAAEASWPAMFSQDFRGIEDYRDGRRTSFVATRRAGT